MDSYDIGYTLGAVAQGVRCATRSFDLELDALRKALSDSHETLELMQSQHEDGCSEMDVSGQLKALEDLQAELKATEKRWQSKADSRKAINDLDLM